jgi:hypothetical protein
VIRVRPTLTPIRCAAASLEPTARRASPSLPRRRVSSARIASTTQMMNMIGIPATVFDSVSVAEAAKSPVGIGLIRSAMPCTPMKVARVAMTGLIFANWTRPPLISPIPIPARIAKASPMMNPPVPFPSVAKPVKMTSPSPIIGPTERSTPAVRSTTSWPSATKISAVESSSRFSMLKLFRKSEFWAWVKIARATITSASTGAATPSPRRKRPRRPTEARCSFFARALRSVVAVTAVPVIFPSVTDSSSSIATVCPRDITITRSQRPTSSRASEEQTTTAQPSAASSRSRR